MKLSPEKKANLLGAVTQVYQGYVALDFFKNRLFQIGNQALTLKQICENAINQGSLKQTIRLNGKNFNLTLTQDNDHQSYQISFTPAEEAPQKALRKPINDYHDDEALLLLSAQNFRIDMDEHHAHISNQLNDHTVIGG